MRHTLILIDFIPPFRLRCLSCSSLDVYDVTALLDVYLWPLCRVDAWWLFELDGAFLLWPVLVFLVPCSPLVHPLTWSVSPPRFRWSPCILLYSALACYSAFPPSRFDAVMTCTLTFSILKVLVNIPRSCSLYSCITCSCYTSSITDVPFSSNP